MVDAAPEPASAPGSRRGAWPSNGTASALGDGHRAGGTGRSGDGLVGRRSRLDTGHLYLGGADPVAVARRAPERVIHVHLKDVDAGLADQLRSGALTFDQAVRRGLFTPLGRGAVDIAGVVEVLEASGFAGWYVLEQDTALEAEPAPAEGPVADARLSLEFLGSLAST